MEAQSMAALNSATINFDDAIETPPSTYPPVQSESVNNVTRSRKPNVPNFSTPSQSTFSTVGGVRNLLPPKPLPGTNLGGLLTTGNNAIKVSNHRRETRGRILALAFPHPLLLIAAMLLIMLFGFLLLSNLVQWWQNWQDDLNYGRPRTFQMDGWVGHNEQGSHPSHFIAQNLDNQVSIIEYPGGDPNKARVLVGPHLFGKGDELLPIRIRLADVNGDGHVDLIATIGDQNIIYINDNGQFRLIRSDERSMIKLSQT